MKKKINESQFRQLVQKIIKETAKDLFKGEEPMDVDMNSMDGLEGKGQINLGSDKNKVKEPTQDSKDPVKVDIQKDMEKMGGEKMINLGTEKNPLVKESKDIDPIDVEMNQNDSEVGQIKKDASPVVQVDATKGTHNGDATKGMAKADYDQKSGANDSKNYNGGDDKGEMHFDVDMEKNDSKIDDEAPKTYVEAGKEGKDGQHDAKVYDKAQNEKDQEPIAKGIQLPEGFENKKYTKKELYDFIVAEAKKIANGKNIL